MSPVNDERNESREWLKEFESFLKQDGVTPPHAVKETVVSHIHGELNPSFQQWGAKLLAIHAVGAMLITTICPQLGVGPFIGGMGLGHIFMKFGQLPCAMFCGAMFLGLTALAANFLLNREELRVANRHRILNVSFLAAISFVGLMLAGGDSDRMSYLFWLVGAFVSGLSILRAGAWLRLREGATPKIAGF